MEESSRERIKPEAVTGTLAAVVFCKVEVQGVTARSELLDPPRQGSADLN